MFLPSYPPDLGIRIVRNILLLLPISQSKLADSAQRHVLKHIPFGREENTCVNDLKEIVLNTVCMILKEAHTLVI